MAINILKPFIVIVLRTEFSQIQTYVLGSMLCILHPHSFILSREIENSLEIAVSR